MALKPDNRIKASMVLVNWIKHKWSKSDEQIQAILGYKSLSSVKVLGLFSSQYEGEWEPIPMSPECFLWNWQAQAREFLLLKRLPAPDADVGQIRSIAQAISGQSGHITQEEAAEWAAEVNARRRK